MRRSEYVGNNIKTMQRLLRRASKLLIISLVCVLGAFESAAVVILPPHIYFRTYMVLSIFIGVCVCSVALWQFLTRHSKRVRRLNRHVVSVTYKTIRCSNVF
ncbi:hypothetical protein KC19_3G219700 [Ceratodon purpureus]|uniref:Uncharacterized protein n=1 Tax=Ceratodon purpureus TaxID=3225 RepID=A0A8T0IMX6_CERPU|nr:hypothetical protein KC19_3G219700 [Ceratodon purpureus]